MNTNTKIDWKICIFSSETIGFVKDTTKEDAEKALIESWEVEQPGRAEKAKLTRMKFVERKKESVEYFNSTTNKFNYTNKSIGELSNLGLDNNISFNNINIYYNSNQNYEKTFFKKTFNTGNNVLNSHNRGNQEENIENNFPSPKYLNDTINENSNNKLLPLSQIVPKHVRNNSTNSFLNSNFLQSQNLSSNISNLKPKNIIEEPIASSNQYLKNSLNLNSIDPFILKQMNLLNSGQNQLFNKTINFNKTISDYPQKFKISNNKVRLKIIDTPKENSFNGKEINEEKYYLSLRNNDDNDENANSIREKLKIANDYYTNFCIYNANKSSSRNPSRSGRNSSLTNKLHVSSYIKSFLDEAHNLPNINKGYDIERECRIQFKSNFQNKLYLVFCLFKQFTYII